MDHFRRRFQPSPIETLRCNRTVERLRANVKRVPSVERLVWLRFDHVATLYQDESVGEIGLLTINPLSTAIQAKSLPDNLAILETKIWLFQERLDGYDYIVLARPVLLSSKHPNGLGKYSIGDENSAGTA